MQATFTPAVDVSRLVLSLSLAERLSLPSCRTNGASTAAADRRFTRWRGQDPFTARAELWHQRLRQDGIEESGLRALLAETREELWQRLGTRMPDGLRRLEPLLTMAEATAPRRGESYAETPNARGFVALVGPQVDAARERIRRALPEDSDRDAVERDWTAELTRRLVAQMNRVLVLELHAAAERGELAGETPEERFRSFTRTLAEPGAAARVFAEYPVLARLVAQTIEHVEAFAAEVARHLSADRELLESRLAPSGRLGRWIGVDCGLSDTHRSGRSVLVLRFDGGTSLVYKPKSLAVDLRFQELLGWLHDRGLAPRQRVLAILDRGDHGWSEHAAAEPCADEAGLGDFYRRLGALLAVLYALEGTDVHHENLIAAGEHPVVVDLEALFHPRLHERGGELGLELATDLIEESVFRTGLLPQRIWGENGGAGLDVSAIGATDAQQTPHSILQLTDVGTDRMRYDRRPGLMPSPHSRPRRADGSDVEPWRYTGEMTAGFEAAYDLLLSHRDELLAPGGPLAAFAETPVRIIARPTHLYSVLLLESYHPFVLRDALDRDRLFDRLWAGVEDRPVLGELIRAERRELWRDDVPVFTTRPGSRDLVSGDGERFRGVLRESGLERVHRRVRTMSAEDRRRQTRLLEGSLEAVALSAREPRWQPHEHRPGAAAEDGSLLDGARRMGARLGREALRHEGSAVWCTCHPVGDSASWSFETVGLDLYGGLPGIALFLAHLGAVTGDAEATRLARESLASTRGLLARHGSFLRAMGAYGGWGGLIYAFSHLGLLWQDDELLDAAVAGVAAIAARVDEDEVLDLVGGSAGAILSLLRLHRLRPEAGALPVAVRCGERLLERATPQARGIGWVLRRAGSQPLAGLSHGTAGFAWALLELGRDSGETRFNLAGREAVAYERSLFDREHRNWPDLRETQRGAHGGGPSFMTAWCHGAPGIGLARLLCRELLADVEVEEEIVAAVGATIEEGFGSSHCLCHGDFGNLDVLLTAARVLGDGGLLERARRLAGGSLESLGTDGPRCGWPLAVPSPGLLVGVAGIGYGLLRLAAPERVPSVLALELPGDAAS